MPLNFLLKTNNQTNHILKYIVFPSIYLSVIALISTNQSLWITSSLDHYYIELFGTILAGILAFYYISRSHNLNEKFSLFIGIGFLVNALIDLLHVIVSLLNMDDILFLKYFIPQTWFAGRLFLSAMLAIAIIKYISLSSTTSTSNIQQQKQKQQQISSNKNNKNNKISKILLLYLITITLFVSIVTISSLYVIFPFSVIDNFPIHRPYELFPLALFLFSLYYFYKNRIYKNRDILYTSLVISIVFNIFGQIIMSYSALYFDTAHGIAHVLKDAGYFINIIGLALSSIQYNRGLRESNRRLGESNEMLSQQYEKVKESEKMKSEFINIAAHELRTPIQPILGLTDIIYSKVKDKELHELLEIIMRNAYRLKRLSDNLLDVTKIEGKSLMFKKEKLNLNVLISEVLKEYTKKEVKQQMIKIVYDFKYLDDIIVEADRDRIDQVIRNLVDNALKFTTMYNNQQTIFVIVDKKKEEEGEGKEQAIVSVKDTGEGISKEVLPKLFSKFTTGDASTGTGLGLYICKNIVEAHRGKIWAENNSDGKGTTFRFTLPIAD
ncbi:MAG TPA: ATP-binding protein [Nitrososphaeraceae archaeon]|nr:ATP-binding protein [Nitrososphaeraceae archaeon]